MTHANDYFSGAGCASQGLHEAGFDVTSFDHWPVAVESHNLNLAGCHLHDLSDATLDHLLPAAAPLEWFSPPCQPFSAAGDQRGEFDERDGFPWALRILGAHLPAVAIFENVKGITFAKHAGYLATILATIRTLGYEVDYKVLNSADYGVPQTRERCFIIARRDGGRIGWPEPTHTPTPGMFTEGWVSMATALGWDDDDLVGFPRRAEAHGEAIEIGGVDYRARDLAPASGPSRALTSKARSWKLNTGLDWKKGGSRDDAQTRDLDDPAPALTSKSAGQWQVTAGSASNATIRSLDEPAPTVLARKDPNGWTLTRPATTIQGDTRVWPPGHNINGSDIAAGRTGNDRAGSKALRLEIPQLARLQDFPDGWQFVGTRTQQATQVGNACPRTFSRLLAEANRPR